MKKIAYFCHGMGLGGIESFLLNVCNNIDRTKYEITFVLAIEPEWETAHEKELRDIGIKIVHISDLDGIKKKLYYSKSVLKLMKEEQFDIVHGNIDLLNGIVLLLAKLAGVKKRICHAHNSETQYNPQGKWRIIKSAMQKAYRRIMQSLIFFAGTDFLACSEEAGRYFFNNKPSIVVYNGIDVQEYSETLKETKNILSPTHRIVTVGRCAPQKNPLFALEVISELRKIRGDFEYLWVGNGELLEDSKRKATALGISDIVKFVGARNDVPQILCNSDFFLFSSAFEGLGISLIEAQFSGLNCVASSNVPELADIGRVTYISLEIGAKKWAEIIDKKLDEPVPPLNKEKAKLFDIKYTVQQLEAIYDK